MIRKSYFSAIVAVLALVACSKDFQEPCPVGPISSDNVHTLSVGIEAGTYTPAEGGTKALMEAVIRVNWTANDEVSVVNATTKKILGGCLKAKESGVSVTFEGTVTGTIDNGDRLYYIYPKLDAEAGEFADAGYNQSLAGQTYDGENPGKVSFFGYAEDVAGSATISKKIQFKLVTSYAHLNMANLPAKGFNLSSIDISKINKGFKWSLTDSGELTADAYGENEGISVNCSNCKITQAGNAVVRFAIPASAATGSEPRVVTVNKAYTNDKYVKDQLIPSAYYNQLYSSWESNVSVSSESDKTKVTVTSDGSTDVAEGVIPVADAFVADKNTEIGIGGVGTVTFDAIATAKIKSNADVEGSTNVFFKVEDVTKTKPVQDANLVYEVTMKTVDEQGVEVFSTEKAAGVATVTVPLGEEVESVTSVALVNESGVVIEGGVVPESVQFANGILTFQVNHFSKYAIKYTVKGGEVDYVAQIGSRKYTTLAKAVEAAQTGNTVTLIKDVVLDKPIETNKTFTLTLNADITPVSEWQTNSNTTDALVIIRRGGNITINGTGKISSDNIANAYAAVKLTNKDEADTGAAAKLTVDGDVTLEGYYYGIVGNGSRQNTEITINGGTIKGTAANDNIGIYHPQAGSLTINGGIIEGSTGIALKGGKLVVNDGTIIGNGVSATFSHNGSGWNNTGDALAVEVCDYPGQNPPQTDLSAEIKGGKFASTNGKPVASYVQPDKSYTPLAGFISGGIYSKQPAAELIPFGYHIEANSDTQTSSAYPWRVVANSAEGAEVSISKQGEATVYSTLAAFRDETNAGNTFAGYTVTLLKDITIPNSNYWKPIGCMNANIYFAGIFDGNGHKVEGLNIDTAQLGTSPDFWPGGFFGYTSGATIKNLTISGETDCAGMVGYAEYTSIIDCVSYVNSNLCYNISGGFIAHADAYVNLSNCKNYGNFICKTSADYAEVGGIVGRFYGGDHCSVTNCENYGSISWEGESGGAQRSLGGIVAGFYNATAISSPQKCVISGCKNYGTIYNKNATSGTTTSTKGGIGGIVGKPFLQGNGIGVTISNCTNSGDIVSSGRTGGIVGTLNEAWQNVGKYSTVSGCTNTGTIYGTDGSCGQIYGIMGTNASDPDKDNILSDNQESGTIKTYAEYSN